MDRARNYLAWKLMNLAYRVATDWYGSMLVGAVYYGLDKAARDKGYRGSPIAPSESYRLKVITSLLRGDEKIVVE